MTTHLAGGSPGGSPSSGNSGDVGGNSQAGASQSGASPETSGLAQEQLYALQEQIQSTRGENSQLKETLDKMRQALVGDDGRQKSDAEPDMTWYDDVLRVALEAEKQGRGIPITVDLATRMKSQIEENLQLKRELAKLAQKVNHTTNPDNLHNLRTYENFDNHIHDQIEQMYGEVDPEFARYVSAKIASELKTLQQKSPDDWNRIRGSETLQQRIVAAAIQQAVPKQIREKLHQDYLRNSPMSLEELAEAYAKADAEIKDPRVRDQVKTKARQEYFANSIHAKKSQSFVGRVNRHRAR
jgi:regulator of replication initiation timing